MHKIIKKTSLVLSLLVLVYFTACAKQRKSDKAAGAEPANVPAVQVNPEIEERG